ncbi:dihydrofolate reductase, partial [Klebsiella pneumoniae]|uniref:dihydrofolate reductase n=1 Tax=Klebsiella pneumoniae TaxID=573 RepID=UPI0038620EE7
MLFFCSLIEGRVVVLWLTFFGFLVSLVRARRSLVISRQANYRATGCVVVSTLSHAIALASELGNELYVAGGAEIYTLALPHAHGVFLSEVHQTFEGDAFFPMLNETEFELVSTETIQAVIPY